MEVPNPIFIKINKGTSDIEQVLKDILALTKLNYNACIYADGLPVTLRFADKIGEILTASIDIKAPPLAFKYIFSLCSNQLTLFFYNQMT